MTPQEQQMIDGLISRIRSTQVQDKDTAAEQHIRQELSGYPDALYVLVQTVLVQQYGLEQAQSQLSELKQQNQQLQDQAQSSQQAKGSGGSFLSHIFGGGSGNQPSQPQQQSPSYQPVNNPGYNQGYPSGGYPPPPPPYQQGYPGAGGGMFGGAGSGGGMFGGGGFLRGALQTAAGVAAGEMVFQGMEDLFHGFGHSGGERGFAQGGGETVVNNYYDDDRGDRSGSRGDDSSFYNPGQDASRDLDGDTGRGFLGGSDDLSGNSDDSASDNSLLDDSGSDDFSGGDDFSIGDDFSGDDNS